MDENEQEEEKAMQTSVIGFPRIGTLRELKFASEKYFRNEIKAEELLQTAKDLRKAHWMTQKEAGITFISSNDFSHYDLYSIRPYCLESFQNGIRSCSYPHWIPTLPWQEDIRVHPVM